MQIVSEIVRQPCDRSEPIEAGVRNTVMRNALIGLLCALFMFGGEAMATEERSSDPLLRTSPQQCALAYRNQWPVVR